MENQLKIQSLEALSQRGCAFLGCEFPILGGAMSWVSERHLVSALSNAGAFGVLACGSMSPELLDAEIAATREMTQRPFGVNLINMHPDISALTDICINHEIRHIVIAGGFPSASLIQKIRDSGRALSYNAASSSKHTIKQRK